MGLAQFTLLCSALPQLVTPVVADFDAFTHAMHATILPCLAARPQAMAIWSSVFLTVLALQRRWGSWEKTRRYLDTWLYERVRGVPQKDLSVLDRAMMDAVFVHGQPARPARSSESAQPSSRTVTKKQKPARQGQTGGGPHAPSRGAERRSCDVWNRTAEMRCSRGATCGFPHVCASCGSADHSNVSCANPIVIPERVPRPASAGGGSVQTAPTKH